MLETTWYGKSDIHSNFDITRTVPWPVIYKHSITGNPIYYNKGEVIFLFFGAL